MLPNQKDTGSKNPKYTIHPIPLSFSPAMLRRGM